MVAIVPTDFVIDSLIVVIKGFGVVVGRGVVDVVV